MQASFWIPTERVADTLVEVKAIIEKVVRRISGSFILQHEIPRISRALSRNPFRDMRRLTKANRGLIIIDAGANEGQSISQFRKYLDHPIIHAFEPSGAFFALQRRTSAISGLRLNNFALGSQSCEMDLIIGENSTLNSFLAPGVDSLGNIKETRKVVVKTLDDYCASQGIPYVDILKSDTQGFDLEVIKGAIKLLTAQRIHLVYLEIIFSAMYKSLPRLDEIYAFLSDHGFRLTDFYNLYYQNDRVAWADALFVNPEFRSGGFLVT